MKRTIMLSLLVATLGISGSASAQTLDGFVVTPMQVKDFTVENTIGIPDTVGWIEVQNLGVEFPPHNASSTESRSGGEQHKIYDYAQAVWNDVTFEVAGNKEDVVAAWDELNAFSKGDNIRGSISVNFVNPKDAYKVIWSFELQELTLIRFSQGLSANVEHPETLRFSFTVSPGYVKISAFMASGSSEDEGTGSDGGPSDLHDGYGPPCQISGGIVQWNLRGTLDGINQQMPLMQSFEYSGMEMQKNDTTIAGDQYGTDTCHVDNYGTIDMEFKAEPKSKDWIDRVKQQYEGTIGGAKPNGGLTLAGRQDQDTARWNVQGWHVERFDFPTLNTKDDARLLPYVRLHSDHCSGCCVCDPDFCE